MICQYSPRNGKVGAIVRGTSRDERHLSSLAMTHGAADPGFDLLHRSSIPLKIWQTRRLRIRIETLFYVPELISSYLCI